MSLPLVIGWRPINDKASWYATEGFAGALRTVQGLANEINTASGGRAAAQEAYDQSRR